MTVQKYLRSWAEPDSVALANRLGRYHAALIVPALGEPLSLLDGYRSAATHADGRVLVILVVNSNGRCSPEQTTTNRQLLDVLRSRTSLAGADAFLVKQGEYDVLAVDRAGPGRELPSKQGVGLARKIGADVALALWTQGRLEQPIIYFTDADAELPDDYFWRCASSNGASAWLFPFCHVSGGNSAVFEATQLYEVSIRYHVLGLAYAQCPYAHQSVGSAIAVHGAAYAAVRGVPKRSAAEDFYLLDKLGKVGPIRRLTGTPVRLESRESSRVPFGTGPRATRIMSDGNLRLANPLAYEVLRRTLAALDRYAKSSDASVFSDLTAGLSPAAALAVRQALDASGLLRAAADAAAQTGQSDLRRRIHGWFNGLRTLRFLHALRDGGIADLGWQAAIATAPFVNYAGEIRVGDVLAKLVELESGLKQDVGVSALTSDGDA